MKVLTDLILFVPVILIAIGDGMLYFFRLIFKIILTSHRFKHIILRLRQSALNFLKFLFSMKFPLPQFTLPRVQIPQHAQLFHRTTTMDIRLWMKQLYERAWKWAFPLSSISHKTKQSANRKTGKFTTTAIARPMDRFKWFAIGIIGTILFLFVPYSAYWWLRTLPNPKLLAQGNVEVTTKIFDRNGVLLYEIFADQNRTPVPLDEIPEIVKQATISIEDQSFYYHPGFSLRGIVRAGRELALSRDLQGGSTITQQLIRSALLTSEVRLSRKVKEIFLAIWAEIIYSKAEILEMYLSQVPYGGTAWGVEAASQMYFGKSIRDVTLAEAAFLAGLPAAPSKYSPYGTNPEKAFERQGQVITRMVDAGYITTKEAEAALSDSVHIAPPRTAIHAPHFVMYVKNILEQRFGARVVERGGLRITTTLDIGLQEKIEEIVAKQIDALAPLRVGNGASIITNPKTGEILAMVGSRNYFDLARQGNVNVTTSLRPPGSAIKVVTYVSALERGLTAATILDDSPITYRSAGSPPYSPVNYDGSYHGPVPLRNALANSYNIPAVKILAKIGVPAMIDKGRAMGIDTWEDEKRFGLSLTLGGGEVTMLDMSEVFGTLANLGEHVDLTPILKIADYTGRTLEDTGKRRSTQAVKQGVAWIINNILSDNTARSAAFGPTSLLVIPKKTVSVKTGTSNDKRDNWTIGFTPSYVVAVWVGNNNNAPMHPSLTSGVTGAAPIWHDIMVELLKDTPDETFPKPNEIVAIPCYNNRTEYFIKGTEPSSGRCAPLPSPSPSPTPTP